MSKTAKNGRKSSASECEGIRGVWPEGCLPEERMRVTKMPWRPPKIPDLPPLASVAAGFDVDIWVGVFAPAGTPSAIVDRLNREINAVATSPELAPVLEPDGTLPEAISAATFAARIKEELGQWKQIATDHKIVAE